MADEHDEMFADAEILCNLGEAHSSLSTHGSDPNHIGFGKHRSSVALSSTCTGLAELARVSRIFPDRCATLYAGRFVDARRIVIFTKALASFLLAADSAYAGSLVKRLMNFSVHNLKVRKAVICFIVIQMMNKLVIGKRPAEAHCHNKSVFEDIAILESVGMSVCPDKPIAKFVEMPTPPPVRGCFGVGFYESDPATPTSWLSRSFFEWLAIGSTIYAWINGRHRLSMPIAEFTIKAKTL